jgi:TPR repeat protein
MVAIRRGLSRAMKQHRPRRSVFAGPGAVLALALGTLLLAGAAFAAEGWALKPADASGWRIAESASGLEARPATGPEGVLLTIAAGIGADREGAAAAMRAAFLARDADAEFGAPLARALPQAGPVMQIIVLNAEGGVSRASLVLVAGGEGGKPLRLVTLGAPEADFAAARSAATALIDSLRWERAPASADPTGIGGDTAQTDPRPAGPSTVAKEARARCDALAAHPSDPRRPAGVRGISYEPLNAGEAIAACQAAYTAFPGETRLGYQLARAFYKAEQPEKALPLIEGGVVGADPMARLLLASAFEEGFGLPADPAKALAIRRELAEAGHPFALFLVGAAYKLGKAVGRDDAEAVRWFRRAAEAGNLSGMNDFGVSLRQGAGVPQNHAEAARWFRRAAEAGDATGMFNIALVLREGQGVPRDVAAALAWFRRAGEEGNADAFSEVGNAYLQGAGTTRDAAEAARWFRKAAEKGSLVGKFNLGICYRDGLGLARDPREALNWLEEADLGGYASAAHQLALMHLEGRGTPVDLPKAADYMLRALAAGEARARQDLAAAARWPAPFRREVQLALKQRKLYSGPIDGVIGSAVLKAIAALPAGGGP